MSNDNDDNDDINNTNTNTNDNSESSSSNNKKLAFSLSSSIGGGGSGGTVKKNSKQQQQKQKQPVSAALGFDDDDDDDDHSLNGSNDNMINPDIPREPLIIPVQQNSRLTGGGGMGSSGNNNSLKSKGEEVAVAVKQENENETKDTLQKEEGNEEEEETQVKPLETVSAEDQAAIDALQAEAGENGDNNKDTSKKSPKIVITGTKNTFQHNDNNNNTTTTKTIDADQESKQQLQKELDQLAPELSVTSKTYRQVPISEFGAAMLRGMGWKGDDDDNKNKNGDDDISSSMPRPSRLGLGATPKFALDAPTHSGRRPRRQDQVQKEKRLLQQQREYEEQRQKMIKLDKQQTIQDGSIVWADVNGRQERAIIRQWQGVPGLNMILIQLEKGSENDNENNPIKVKRGSVQLVARSELLEHPFQEPPANDIKISTETKYVGEEEKEKEKDMERSDDHRRRRDDDRKSRRRSRDDDYSDNDRDDERRRRHRREDDEKDDRRHSSKSRHRSRDDDYNDHDDDKDNKRRDHHHHDRRHRHDDDRDRNRDRRRDNEPSSSDSRKKRRHESDHRRDDDNYDNKNEKKRRREDEPKRHETWLIPNIRVRIISSKYGKSNYKEKGVVVDVTAKGTATLSMSNSGQVLHVPERHLETALPKVGGNACILTGTHRFAKGRLLERDSKANKGSVQVFEDMNIVTTSLDDMAEWCGPLDDDLME